MGRDRASTESKSGTSQSESGTRRSIKEARTQSQAARGSSQATPWPSTARASHRQRTGHAQLASNALARHARLASFAVAPQRSSLSRRQAVARRANGHRGARQWPGQPVATCHAVATQKPGHTPASRHGMARIKPREAASKVGADHATEWPRTGHVRHASSGCRPRRTAAIRILRAHQGINSLARSPACPPTHPPPVTRPSSHPLTHRRREDRQRGRRQWQAERQAGRQAGGEQWQRASEGERGHRQAHMQQSQVGR